MAAIARLLVLSVVACLLAGMASVGQLAPAAAVRTPSPRLFVTADAASGAGSGQAPDVRTQKPSPKKKASPKKRRSRRPKTAIPPDELHEDALRAQEFVDKHRGRVPDNRWTSEALLELFRDMRRTREPSKQRSALNQLVFYKKLLSDPDNLVVQPMPAVKPLPPGRRADPDKRRTPDAIVQRLLSSGKTTWRRAEEKTVTLTPNGINDSWRLRELSVDDLVTTTKNALRTDPDGSGGRRASQLTSQLWVPGTWEPVPKEGDYYIVVNLFGLDAATGDTSATNLLAEYVDEARKYAPFSLANAAKYGTRPGTGLVYMTSDLRVATRLELTSSGWEKRPAPSGSGPAVLAPEQPAKSASTTESAEPSGSASARTRCTGLMGSCPLNPAPVSNDVVGSLEQAASNAPGGIDFSSLSLRYLSLGESKDEGVGYAFSADPGAQGTTVGDGVANALQASDAFFVWLALRPSTFWVNLKPNEPDTIIDPKLGRTAVGRIMLEADFSLKRTSSALVDPNTAAGARLWAVIGRRCMPGLRLWITPGVAKVREDGNQLYIVDAPLDVRIEQFDYHPRQGDPLPPSLGRSCPQQPDSVNGRIIAAYRRIILPKVVHAVNTAPAYAALRRIYLSRVAAQWYRDRSAQQQTTFGNIVDSGRIGRWVEHGTWRPKLTFRRYVKAFSHGQFRFTKTWREGNRVYTMTVVTGGVDFSAVPRKAVGQAAFKRTGLGPAVDRSLHGGTVTRSGTGWVGGESHVDPTALARAFPPVREPSGPSKSMASSDRLRDLAPYAVGGLLLAGLATIGVAVRRRLRG